MLKLGDLVTIYGQDHARGEGAETGVKEVDPTTNDAFDNMFDGSGMDDITVENNSVTASATKTHQRANTLSSRCLRRRNRPTYALVATVTQMASVIHKAYSDDPAKVGAALMVSACLNYL